MKVTIAIDSMKGSISSLMAGNAAREGVLAACPTAEVCVSPLADGGEGTVDAILASGIAEARELTVTGPLGKPVLAKYAVIPASGTAVIEMAAAAGLPLLSSEERNPLYTTTYGVGELIAHAIREDGCRRFVIGIGGSATNDGGTGMLSALGFSFRDAAGAPIAQGALGLTSLASISRDGAEPLLSACEFRVACDVTNPLCGERGCSAVFAPQKGATPEMVRDMDAWLSAYAALTEKTVGASLRDTAGAGAAGGLGFAFLAYLGATLTSGVALVTELTGLEEKIKDADFVLTGEGRLDGQSAMGKAPIGVARLAKKYGKPVIALAGCVTSDASENNRHGIDAFFPILPAPMPLSEAMAEENAYRNMKNTAEQVFRLISAVK